MESQNIFAMKVISKWCNSTKWICFQRSFLKHLTWVFYKIVYLGLTMRWELCWKFPPHSMTVNTNMIQLAVCTHMSTHMCANRYRYRIYYNKRPYSNKRPPPDLKMKPTIMYTILSLKTTLVRTYPLCNLRSILRGAFTRINTVPY